MKKLSLKENLILLVSRGFFEFLFFKKHTKITKLLLKAKYVFGIQ
jgi:hypothetical protein